MNVADNDQNAARTLPDGCAEVVRLFEDKPDVTELADNIPDDYRVKGRHLILTTGEFYRSPYDRKPLEITTDMLETMQANFNKGIRGQERNGMRSDLPVDVDHMRGEAMGWIEGLEIEDGARLYAQTEWNPEGLRMIRRDIYRYVSVTFSHDYIDEQQEEHGECLYGFSLTNYPFMKKLGKLEVEASERSRRMRDENILKGTELDGLDPDEARAKIQEMSAKLKEQDAQLKERDADSDAEKRTLRSQLDKEKARANAFEEQLDEAAELGKKRDEAIEELREAEMERFIIDAKEKGLLVHSQLYDEDGNEKALREWARKDPKAFRDHVNSLEPRTALKEEKGTPAGNEDGGATDKDPRDQIHQAALEFMDNERIDYATALDRVQETNPKLVDSVYSGAAHKQRKADVRGQATGTTGD